MQDTKHSYGEILPTPTKVCCNLLEWIKHRINIDTTPGVVLRRLALAASIKILPETDVNNNRGIRQAIITFLGEMKESIYITPLTNGAYPFTEKDYIQKMVFLLNPQKDWDAREVEPLFRKTIRMFSDAKFFLKKLTDAWEENKIDEETIHPVVIYKHCNDNDIKLLPTHNVRDMCTLFLLHHNALDVSTIYKYIPQHIYQNILTAHAGEMKIKCLTYDAKECSTIADNFEGYALKKFSPSTPAEMVVSAYIRWGINLTPFKNIPSAYEKILSSIASPKAYLPLETILNASFITKPFTIFDPRIPLNLYSRSCFGQNRSSLLTIAHIYSVNTGGNIQGVYDQLTEKYIEEMSTPSFFPGRMPNVKDMRTPITGEVLPYMAEDLLEGSGSFVKSREDIKEVSIYRASDLYSYGKVDGEMICFTADELADLFASGTLYNPLDSNKTVFSKHAMSKLRILSGTSGHNKLFSAVVSAIELKESMDKKSEMFIADAKVPSAVRSASLKKLMYLGFMMRGWNGEGKIPVDESPVDNQSAIDTRVTAAMADFEEGEKKYPTGLLNVPIYLITEGQHRYTPSNDAKKGFTLAERLNIVKKETEENVNACIRLTSNWFISTAYRLMKMSGIDPGFDISKLRHVQ